MSRKDTTRATQTLERKLSEEDQLPDVDEAIEDHHTVAGCGTSVGARLEALAIRGQKMIEAGGSIESKPDAHWQESDWFFPRLRGNDDGEPFADLAVLVAWIVSETGPTS